MASRIAAHLIALRVNASGPASGQWPHWGWDDGDAALSRERTTCEDVEEIVAIDRFHQWRSVHGWAVA